jgi:hypothetical protein
MENKMEFLIALLSNLQCWLIIVTCGVVGTGGATAFFSYMEAHSYDRDEGHHKRLQWLRSKIWVAVVLSLLCCVPSVEDIWKARIALIELRLSSPQNVQAGVDTVQRLAKELECEYLHKCPKEEK